MAKRVIKVKPSEVQAARVQLAALEAADLDIDPYLLRLASVPLKSDNEHRVYIGNHLTLSNPNKQG